MAWVAIETFEGYADEANLAGQTGGSGWSDGWSNAASNTILSDTATASEGSVSARAVSNAGNTFYTRDLTTAISDAGVIYVSLRKSSTSAGENAFSLRAGGNRVSCKLDSSGNAVVGSATMFSFSANTWYDIRITFDVSAGTYTGAYWTGSAWSAESATQTMGSSGNITKVGIGGDTGSSSWVDNITSVDPHPVTYTPSPIAHILQMM